MLLSWSNSKINVWQEITRTKDITTHSLGLKILLLSLKFRFSNKRDLGHAKKSKYNKQRS